MKTDDLMSSSETSSSELENPTISIENVLKNERSTSRRDWKWATLLNFLALLGTGVCQFIRTGPLRWDLFDFFKKEEPPRPWPTASPSPSEDFKLTNLIMTIMSDSSFQFTTEDLKTEAPQDLQVMKGSICYVPSPPLFNPWEFSLGEDPCMLQDTIWEMMMPIMEWCCDFGADHGSWCSNAEIP
jgi:hypothetical protein